ncbi:triphosphoribosyl-dephospho-CoA synthase [Sedimenticola thiotaurini]|uniref:triphosphoribosyl-dephospho-CoA synthase n=1 Tax=Sedimenticola thiotaurini TaxID=1543721 RepID=UPI00069AD9E1|nr:triphosphoribosyl-dephospho-CoA synthase [Sedimenticola thiotaurini]
MTPITTQQLETHYLDACFLDVAALKPGNVSFHAGGHGMDGELFLRSALVSAEVLLQPGLALGERIYRAVKVTGDTVGCNTNLGIILLCAPVIQALLEYPEQPLEQGLRQVLSAAGIADTQQVFAAIQLANPGGLGSAADHDVSGPATASLTTVMTVAAERDLIARQYSNGFRELCRVAVPHLDHLMQRGGDEKSALTDLFLHMLARYPDSHIVRKHGEEKAAIVSRWAADLHRQYLAAEDDEVGHDLLLGLDQKLKQLEINPGTTADFCVAGVFIHRLQQQAINTTGVARNYPRTMKPFQADNPQIQ